MKKDARRDVVTGAPIVVDSLTIIQIVSAYAFNGNHTRARICVCVACVPGCTRHELRDLVGVTYDRMRYHLNELIECGAVSVCGKNRRLWVTSVGMEEIEALANDLLWNVSALRSKVALMRYGRPEYLDMGLTRK